MAYIPQSGSVAAFIKGDASVLTIPKGSVITVAQGSVAATIINTNVNVSGSVAAWLTGSASVISVPSGSVITVIQGSVATVGTTANQSVSGTIDIGIASGSVASHIKSGSVVAVLGGNTSVLAVQSGAWSTSIVGIGAVAASISGVVNVAGSVVSFPGAGWSGSVIAQIASSVLTVTSGTVTANQGTGFGSIATHIKSGSVVAVLGGNTSVVAVQATTWPGSVMAFLQGNASVITVVQGSVAVSVTPAANQSVSGVVGASIIGVPYVMIAGSVAAQMTPAANQSVSGTVDIGVIPGSVVAFQGTTPWLIGSVYGNVSGSVLSVESSANPGSVAAHIKSGSVIALLGNTSVVAVASTTWPGSVFAFLGSSIYGNISGSVAATITNTNLNVGGSVVAFQASTWPGSVLAVIKSGINASISGTVNIAGNPSVSGTLGSTQQGTWITSISGVAYPEDTGHSTAAPGLFTLGVRNDGVASFVSADLDYTPIGVDSAGRNLIKPFAASESQIEGVGMTYGTASIVLVGAAGAGIRNYITDIIIANPGAATTLVTFTDSTASILGYTIAPATGGSNIPGLATPIRTAANASFWMAGATVTSLYGTVRGYKGP